MITKIKKIIRKFLPEPIIIFLWHLPQSFLAALIHRFPARKIIVIGVAGTKGKTTTCNLISQLLEGAGQKTAMISTALVKIGSKTELNNIKMTTPSPFFLQGFIKKAVKEKCQYLVLETSSHALVQYRTLTIHFKIAVLTNMMSDHLEYHKTKEDYTDAHLKMVSSHLEYLILNGDDPNLDKFKNLTLSSGKKIIYGLENKRDILGTNLSLNSKGSSFQVKSVQSLIEIKTALLGKFNIYNSLAAITTALSQNINLAIIKKTMSQIVDTPGRMERINCGQKFEVVVDYAHSVDSFRNLFELVSSLGVRKIITVFGACGDRDPTVRPLMGKIVEQNSDYIIITNDDPYSEDPEKIAQGLLNGMIERKEKIWKILDRREAIRKAISLAQEGDLVLVLGKGSEQWQVFNTQRIPWDDRQIVREILHEKK